MKVELYSNIDTAEADPLAFGSPPLHESFSVKFIRSVSARSPHGAICLTDAQCRNVRKGIHEEDSI